MTRTLEFAFVGLSLSSSWGNGHATTYRALLRGLYELGHRVVFLERDVPWYASNRDLADPDFCALRYYDAVAELRRGHASVIERADAVVIGSYVPDGVAVIDAVSAMATGQVCFYDIDTPITLAKLRQGEQEYLAPQQIPLFDHYFSFTGGPTLDRLRSEFGARRATPLFCAVDPLLYTGTREPRVWDLGYLGTYSPDRQPTLERLLLETARQLPDRRFVVAGPQYPSSTDWPANVDRIEHLPPREHASFYSRQRYTLNVTRADMIEAGWSPSVRLFEAAACGTPIISDRWPGIEQIFGRDIHLATDTADVFAILLEEDEATRQRMADAAKARVLTNHTALKRATELAEHISRSSRRCVSASTAEPVASPA